MISAACANALKNAKHCQKSVVGPKERQSPLREVSQLLGSYIFRAYYTQPMHKQAVLSSMNRIAYWITYAGLNAPNQQFENTASEQIADEI